MSTDADLTGPPRAAPSSRAFRRLLYGSIAVFALLALGLVALNLSQGPRLTSAQLNVQTSVERAGQRLLLESNEVLAPVGDAQISVTPSVSVATTSNQTSIQVEFTSILEYNTTYTVTATGVKSASQNAESTFSYSFTTPDANVAFLVPGSAVSTAGTAPDDRIERASLTGGTTETLYSAPHISRFATMGQKLVVATTDADGYDLLDIITPDGSAAPIPVQLAGPGTVTGLTASAKSNLFGYTYRAAPSPYYPTANEQLYIYDTTLGQAFSIPVTGPDHELLDVTSWFFVPGTTSLVARSPDGSLYLADVLGLLDGSSGTVGVGSADALQGFVPGTKSLVTERSGATFTIDFGTPGNPVTAPLAEAGGAAGAGSGASASPPVQTQTALPLDASGTVVARSSDATALVKRDASASTTVFTTPDGTPITHFCLSTNGRYAVASTSAGTTYIPLAGSAEPRTFPGSQPDWCSAG